MTALCSGTGTKTKPGLASSHGVERALLGDVRRNDHDLVLGFVHLLPAERFTPPLGLGLYVEAVDDDRVPAQRHALTIPTETSCS